jgi:hypothetical protein
MPDVCYEDPPLDDDLRVAKSAVILIKIFDLYD